MSDPALAPLRLGAGNRHAQECDTEHSQGRPAIMIFINGSSENCRIQRALLLNRCLAGSLFLFPCFLVSGPQLPDASSMRWRSPLNVPWVFQFEEGSQNYKPIVLRGLFKMDHLPELQKSRKAGTPKYGRVAGVDVLHAGGVCKICG
jgi:hypothetical protein